MFDITDPAFLAFLESEGCLDTSESCIQRVAAVLNESPNEVINTEEFRDACYAAGVDPDSFSQSDLDRLQELLD